jgi:hypothetical protein
MNSWGGKNLFVQPSKGLVLRVKKPSFQQHASM